VSYAIPHQPAMSMPHDGAIATACTLDRSLATSCIARIKFHRGFFRTD
jgi:hypothetical protein